MDKICLSCNLDTAGQHEWGCPNKEVYDVPTNVRVKGWGLFEGLKVSEEEIEEAKRATFGQKKNKI